MPDELLHSPAERPPVAGRKDRRRCLALIGLIVAASPLLGACSMSFPMASMVPAGDDVTGSLAEVPFGQLLNEEDRRREKAALATALDPQGDGATIHWENPKTGHKGSITAVGHAYPADTRICRAFTGDVRHNGGQRTMQGTACTIAAGEWAVRETKAPKKA